MSAALKIAVTRADAAQKALETVFRLEYPLHTRGRWRRGRGVSLTGTIDSEVYGNRVRVRNSRTKKSYWITAYDILRAMGV